MIRGILVLTAIVLLVQCSQQESQTENSVTVPVSVVETTPRPFEERLTVTGTVFATKEAELNSEITGLYKLRKNPKTGKPFALGDFVKKGRTIVGLYDAEYANSIKPESEKLSFDMARQEYEKLQSLYEKGGISQQDLKNAELSLTNAKYSYESSLMRGSKMAISAPFDGVIVELPYSTQNTRIASGQLLFKIMDYRKLHLEVRFSAREMGRIQPGQPVHLTNYSLPDDTIAGSIDQVSPAIDAESRTFQTVITAENPDWKFRPGMFVKAEVVVASKDSAIAVPKDIILSNRRGKTVFVIERGRARERTITTGIESATEVEVLTGLQANQRLVVKGFETLQNGSRVTILK